MNLGFAVLPRMSRRGPLAAARAWASRLAKPAATGGGQARTRNGRSRTLSESGHALLIVVVMVAVMIVGSTVAMKVWSTVIKREKEEELIFRGRQYAMALYQYRKVSAGGPAGQPAGQGGLPIDLKQLEEKVGQKQVFVLRRPYKDPITGGDFGVIFAGPNNTPIPDEPLETGDSGLSNDDPDDGGLDPPEKPDSPSNTLNPGNPGNPGNPAGNPPSAFGTPSGTATGLPIMGVHSKSKDQAQGPARWRDLEHYNEWFFLVTDITNTGQPGQNPGQVLPGQQLPGQQLPGQQPPGLPGQTPGGGRGATPGVDRPR